MTAAGTSVAEGREPARQPAREHGGPVGTPARCGVVVRADIPPRRACREAVTDLVRVLLRQGHGAVVALVASDRPREELVATLRSVTAEEGLPLLDVIGVGPDSYRSLVCADPECCPPEGTPLLAVQTSRTAAAMVVEGCSLAPDEASLVADVTPDVGAQLAEDLFGDPPRWTTPRRMRLLARCARLLAAQGGPEPAEVSEEDLVELGLALEDLLLRDAVILALTAPVGPDGLEAARLLVSGRDEQALVLTDRCGRNEEHLERGRRLTGALARRAPAGRRAEVLAVMAWLAWWQGDGVRARLLAERAVRDRPGHRLAHLVLTALAAALPPPWVGTAAVATS